MVIEFKSIRSVNFQALSQQSAVLILNRETLRHRNQSAHKYFIFMRHEPQKHKMDDEELSKTFLVDLIFI